MTTRAVDLNDPAEISHPIASAGTIAHEIGDLTCDHLGWAVHIRGRRHIIEQVHHFTAPDGLPYTQVDSTTVLPSHTSCYLHFGRHHSE